MSLPKNFIELDCPQHKEKWAIKAAEITEVLKANAVCRVKIDGEWHEINETYEAVLKKIKDAT